MDIREAGGALYSDQCCFIQSLSIQVLMCPTADCVKAIQRPDLICVWLSIPGDADMTTSFYKIN